MTCTHCPHHCPKEPEENKSAFEEFWKAYPRKELKKKAKEIWRRHHCDEFLPEILSFIEKAKKTDRWQDGYIKQPTAFLTGRCWEDELTYYNRQEGQPLEIHRY